MARNNPHHHQTIRWLGEKIMPLLRQQGLLTRMSCPVYRHAHLI